MDMRLDATRKRAGQAARAIIAIGLFIGMIYGLLAGPGLLTDLASTVPLIPARKGIERP
jgi:UPF0716 family protein affecting phage T7 exclusion